MTTATLAVLRSHPRGQSHRHVVQARATDHAHGTGRIHEYHIPKTRTLFDLVE